MSIVAVAIVPNQVHVFDELIARVVTVMTQFLFNCTQVHRLPYYIEVVHDTESDWVHWFLEVVCSFQFAAVCYNLQT